MITLVGKPTRVGPKHLLYKAKLFSDDLKLGADFERISIAFDYVDNQEVTVDPKTAGRYTVEKFGTKGHFEWIEKEGSDIDQLLKKNLDNEEPFEFSVKGPYGRTKYIGNGKFYK